MTYKADEEIHARSGNKRRVSSPFQQCWSGRVLLVFPLLAKQKRVSDLTLGHCRFAARQLENAPRSADFFEAFGVSMAEVHTFVCDGCGALLGSGQNDQLGRALCRGHTTVTGSKLSKFTVDFDAGSAQLSLSEL